MQTPPLPLSLLGKISDHGLKHLYFSRLLHGILMTLWFSNYSISGLCFEQLMWGFAISALVSQQTDYVRLGAGDLPRPRNMQDVSGWPEEPTALHGATP
jgi:hypothetical protein